MRLYGNLRLFIVVVVYSIMKTLNILTDENEAYKYVFLNLRVYFSNATPIIYTAFTIGSISVNWNTNHDEICLLIDQ